MTVLVPMAGFTAVSVLEADDAKKAGIDLTAAGSDLDQFPGAATELAGPAAIERYTRALDDSTSTHTDSTDVTVTLASDVTSPPTPRTWPRVPRPSSKPSPAGSPSISTAGR